MARYGLTVFGTDYYGEAVDREFDSSPFTAVCIDYDEVYVSWVIAGGRWTKQRLVRNATGVPLSERDGTSLLEQDFDGSLSQDYTDTGLTSGRTYYYALFVLDTEGRWRGVGEAECLVVRDFGYTNRLWERLPDVFKSADYQNLNSAGISDERSFLYRFLSVFGFQLDYIRTSTETLRHVLDARTVSASLLPSLAAEVGLQPEPLIGSRSFRRYVQNAVRLYGLKGTSAGIRELATVLTGWGAGVQIGYNLALDDLDAGPKGDVGRWRAKANATVRWQRNTATSQAQVGTGYRDTSEFVDGLLQVQLDMNRGGEDGARRLQYAIPVLQGRDYLVSQYVRTPGLTNVVASVALTWLDRFGRQIGVQIVGDPVTADGSWAARPTLQQSAPSGARYLEAALLLERPGGFAPSDHVHDCGFMVQEDTELKPWQCAREVIVNLFAETVNECPTPTPFSAGDPRWTGGAHELDGTLGWTVPASAPTPAESTPTTTVLQPVLEGERWSISCEISSGVDGQVIGAVFYDINGTELGNSSLPAVSSPQAWSTLGTVVTVPEGARYLRPFVRTTSTTVGSFRRFTVARSETVVEPFDGGIPSRTGDYLWEGVPYGSRSHYYGQRITRTARLREVMSDYVANGTCFAFRFAQPRGVVVLQPGAVEDYVINPGPPGAPPPVGRSLELVWGVSAHVGASRVFRWNTLANPPKIHDTFSRSIPPSQTDIGVGEDGVPWTLTCSGGAYWGDNALSGRDSNSNGGITTMRPSGDAGSTTGSAYISKQLGPPAGGTLYDVTVVNYRYSSGGSDEMRIYNADGSYFSFGWDGYNLGYHALQLNAADNSILQTIGNVPGWGFIPGAGTLRMTYDTGSKLATMSLNGSTLISGTVTAADPTPDHFRYSSVGDNTPTGVLDSWLLSVTQA